MMNKKTLTQPPSGRGGVQTGLGRTGGPTFGSYLRVPGGTSGPSQFAQAAAVAGHNDPQQSIPQRRPTQQQERDNPGQYSSPRAQYTPPSEGRPPQVAHETATGRPGGPRAVGPYSLPMANNPAGGGVQTDLTGRQPYAGREPMMARMSGPAISATADSNTNPGVGGLTTGHAGPIAASGNFPGSFASRGDQTGTAADEGLRTRDAVRALARRNGGTPADTERGGSHPGGLRTSYESHQPSEGAIGINGPGSGREPGMESHG